MKEEIKSLENRIKDKQEELAWVVDGQRKKELKHYNLDFGNLYNIDPEITIANGYEGFEVRKKNEEGLTREIFSVRYLMEDYRDIYPTKLCLNYYTTSINSEFELNRLKLLGSVAELILENEKWILEDYKETVKPFMETRQKIVEKIWDLKEEKNKLVKLQRENEREEKLEKAFSMEGLDLRKSDENKSSHYPKIELRGDWVARNVSNIRILDYVNPETKKSVNLEITESPMQYDCEKGEYIECESKTYIVKKVRLSNIIGFIINHSK